MKYYGAVVLNRWRIVFKLGTHRHIRPRSGCATPFSTCLLSAASCVAGMYKSATIPSGVQQQVPGDAVRTGSPVPERLLCTGALMHRWKELSSKTKREVNDLPNLGRPSALSALA